MHVHMHYYYILFYFILFYLFILKQQTEKIGYKQYILTIQIWTCETTWSAPIF